MQNGCFANHLPVKPNVQSVTTYLKAVGYDVVLAGKSHVKPINVFDWTHYFPSVKHRFLPLEEIEGYLKTTEKPFCMLLLPTIRTDPILKQQLIPIRIFTDCLTPPKRHLLSKGYYENIKNDNAQLEHVLEMVKTWIQTIPCLSMLLIMVLQESGAFLNLDFVYL